jgi:hypothetical protein
LAYSLLTVRVRRREGGLVVKGLSVLRFTTAAALALSAVACAVMNPLDEYSSGTLRPTFDSALSDQAIPEPADSQGADVTSPVLDASGADGGPDGRPRSDSGVVYFFDDFERQDGMILNGWVEKSPNWMALRDGKVLVLTAPSFRGPVVYRPTDPDALAAGSLAFGPSEWFSPWT